MTPIEYRCTREDMDAFYRRYVERSTILQVALRKQRWLWALVWVIWSIVLAWQTHWWSAIGLGCVAACCIYVAYPRRFYRRAIGAVRRSLEPNGAKCWDHPHQLELTPTGFRSVCERADITMPWNRIVAVEADDTRTIAFLDDGGSLTVSRAGMISGNYDEVRRELTAHSPEAAGPEAARR